MKHLPLSRYLTSPLPLSTSVALLPLRLLIGGGFIEHGYAKLARGPDVFIHILHAIGVPFPELLGWATILVEVLGGIFVVLGAFVPPVSVPMIVVLATAIFSVHLPYGFSSIKLLAFDTGGAHFGPPGYETDLLYVAGILVLCVVGTGPLSVDRWLRGR